MIKCSGYTYYPSKCPEKQKAKEIFLVSFTYAISYEVAMTESYI